MTTPGASSIPPGIGFGAGGLRRVDEREAAAPAGEAHARLAAPPVTVPAAVRTNLRRSRTPPGSDLAMRLLFARRCRSTAVPEDTAGRSPGQCEMQAPAFAVCSIPGRRYDR